MLLSPYLLLPLIEILFFAALLALLMVLGRRHKAVKPFALFLFFMALWGMAIFLMRSSSDLVRALTWERLVFASVISASISFYWFIASFTDTKVHKLTFSPLIISYVFAMALIPTNLIVRGMQSMWYGKAPVVGHLFFIYVLCVYVPLILGLLALIKHYKQSKINDEKTRDQYIIAGLIAMFIGGTTDYRPALGVSTYPLGVVGGVLFGILATVAMLRYGLLEIRVVLRKGAAYSMVSVLIFGIFGSIVFILSTVFQSVVSPLSLAITIAAIFFIAAIFQPLLQRLQRVVDKWFFKERYDYLQALRKLATETDGDLDLNQLSSALVTTVANSMQSGGVYLLLSSPLTGDFITTAFCGHKSQSDIAFPAEGTLATTLKYLGRIVDSNDMQEMLSLSSLSQPEKNIFIENDIELVIPLRHENNLSGVLLLGKKSTGESYANEDRQLLQSVSPDIASRIENASRLENIKKEHSELQKTMEGIIYAVSAVVESRDPYTAGHQRRVAELAKAIAGEMGLSEWHQKGVHIIGLLHDVGKIAVPAEILSKPGKINQYEFDIIKNHSRTGFEILEKIDFPWKVSEAILQHHERYNGSGYPQGLSKDEIILEARILSVADVIEAMSSHRPYRPALGLDNALQEITKNRGILYDPKVADACVKLLRNKQPEFEKLMSAANQENTLTAARKVGVK